MREKKDNKFINTNIVNMRTMRHASEGDNGNNGVKSCK